MNFSQAIHCPKCCNDYNFMYLLTQDEYFQDIFYVRGSKNRLKNGLT